MITENSLTPQWLTACLRQSGDLVQGTATRITIKERYPNGFHFEVAYSAEAAGTRPRHLFYKLSEKGAVNAMVECLLYDDIAPAMTDPPVPRRYYAAIDPQTDYADLILEDVAHTHRPWYKTWPENGVLTAENLKVYIDTLLKFHTCWWEHPRLDRPDFLTPISNIVAGIQATAPDDIRRLCQHCAEVDLPLFIEQHGDAFPPSWITFYENLLAAWPPVHIARTTAGKALTLIHGDPNMGHLYMPLNAQTHRLLLIDWETCTRGIGVYDLAYMLYGVPADTRKAIERELIAYYHRRLLEHGIKYAWEDCLEDYRFSVTAYLFGTLKWRKLDKAEYAMKVFHAWDCAEMLH